MFTLPKLIEERYAAVVTTSENANDAGNDATKPYIHKSWEIVSLLLCCSKYFDGVVPILASM